MLSKIQGRAWKLGDDVDTDQIIPARYLVTSDPARLAVHCMEAAAPGFAAGVKPGDLLVAGKNFGCGSSREHAPLALKGCGVACVVARGFARIFYRNSFNVGLPIVECPEAVDGIEEGDDLEVDLAQGTIRNATRGEVFRMRPIPPFMLELIADGGLIPHIARVKHAGSGGPSR